MAGMLARSGPPGNKNDVKHGLYAYKAMLEGKGPPTWIPQHARLRLHLVRRCVSKNLRTGAHD